MAGKYEECIRQCESATREGITNEEWPILLAQALMIVGRYPDAENVVSNALPQLRASVRLRVAAYEVFRSNGHLDQANEMLDDINNLIGSRMRAYRDADNFVALGKAALWLKVDAKQVLENLFDRAKKADPDNRETYRAIGDVALDKHDYSLAAKTFSEALKRFPEDADMHAGLARAYAPSSRSEMLKEIEAALRYNPNHVPARLLLVDHHVDAEEYAEAEKELKAVLAVNPWHPEAWAYRAVLAHLRNDATAELAARENGLRFGKTNPEVDHCIGRQLSQKYRFTEGANYQRRALQFDPEFLPAKIQLAQDLLRLGQEDEGWRLVHEVEKADGYDVSAFNLATLHDSLSHFSTLRNDNFIVHMTPREAALYGHRVLALLHRAKTNLCEKYGVELKQPTTIDLFDKQSDFAVRTFGMPHNPGFLGVCFGPVVTANSPASAGGHPSNWESVLWHEFCHVVTLSLTRNKMPRWLSEGISVYEERQANAARGQRMNPRYREMILEGELTPVGELSAAFLSPKSDRHLQFAYYESSLVVEFLVDRYGLDSLKRILRDLAEGATINKTIAAHTAPLDAVEKDFAAYAKQRARQFGAELDWTKPKPATTRGSAEALAVQAKKDPPNFWILTEYAKALLAEKRWKEAQAPLQKLIERCPDQTGTDSAYGLLAAAHRGLNETNQERDVLANLAAQDGDNTDAYLRLMELGAEANDWTRVAENAERFLAVNPLLAQPYRFLARAGEALGNPTMAIESYRRLLLLDPPDPADVHFRLARLLRQGDEAAAKRHVLQALEEAPQFRDAHRLLLELNRLKSGQASGTVN